MCINNLYHKVRELCPLERRRIAREAYADWKTGQADIWLRLWPKPDTDPAIKLKILTAFSKSSAIPMEFHDDFDQLFVISTYGYTPLISGVLLGIKAATLSGILVNPQLSGVCIGIKASVGSAYCFKKLTTFTILDN